MVSENKQKKIKEKYRQQEQEWREDCGIQKREWERERDVREIKMGTRHTGERHSNNRARKCKLPATTASARLLISVQLADRAGRGRQDSWR